MNEERNKTAQPDNSRKTGIKRSVIQVYELLEAITEANTADGVARGDIMED